MISLVVVLAGCASTVVYPDGKEMRFTKGFGLRNFEATYKDKEAKKEYTSRGDSNISLPDISLLTLPGIGK